MNTYRKIYINDKAWIDWIDFDTSTTNYDIIDELMEETAYFWRELEVACVAECCGIEAFSFREDIISSVLTRHERVLIHQQLNKALTKIKALKQEVVLYHKWNQYMHRDFLVALVEHVLQVADGQQGR